MVQVRLMKLNIQGMNLQITITYNFLGDAMVGGEDSRVYTWNKNWQLMWNQLQSLLLKIKTK